MDEELKNNKNRFGRSGTLIPFCRQMFASCGPVVLTLSSGMTNGYSAILIPQLPASHIRVTEEMASWIAGIVTLAMPFGGILGGLLMDNFGRKRAQQLCCLVCLIGWLDIALSPNVAVLCVGRFLTGLCVGLISAIGAVYMAEICEPRYRGFLLALVTFAVSLGILIVHVLGTYLHWRLIAFMSMSIAALSFLIVCISPETPTWLICKGLTEEAERSFYWLRPNKYGAENELDGLLMKYSTTIGDFEGDSKQRTSRRRKKLSYAVSLKSYIFWKPFLITAILFVTQQFSGINAIVFYTVNIVKKASPDFNEYAITITIDVCRVIVSIFACWLLKRCNRRSVFLVSAIGSVICLFVLAVCLKFFQYVLSGWLPVVFIISYVIFSTVGLVPLPWIMTGEIYPVAVRDIGNGVSNCFAFLIMFTVVKTAPSFFYTFGLAGTFCLYGMITATGTVILYFFLPETNNKSLQEVEEVVVENRILTEK